MAIEVTRHGEWSYRVVAPELDAAFAVWGPAPILGDGTVLGRSIYFKARGDDWELGIADEQGMFLEDGSRDPGVFHRDGRLERAGLMPGRDAVTLVLRLLSEYTGVAIHLGAIRWP